MLDCLSTMESGAFLQDTWGVLWRTDCFLIFKTDLTFGRSVPEKVYVGLCVPSCLLRWIAALWSVGFSSLVLPGEIVFQCVVKLSCCFVHVIRLVTLFDLSVFISTSVCIAFMANADSSADLTRYVWAVRILVLVYWICSNSYIVYSVKMLWSRQSMSR